MRNDTMGIILTGDEKIAPLTNIRANSALPIAGRYRIIDFVLSNMANSGITNVGIATESNYSSLMDHTRSGKPWDLDRKDQGLQILPPNIENEKYGVILHTIGVYSVNTKDKNVMKVQKEIHDIVFSHKGILQMHGFYYDEEDKSISFDIIIDFKVKNREEVYQEIYDEVQNKYKDYKISITLDVDISD